MRPIYMSYRRLIAIFSVSRQFNEGEKGLFTVNWKWAMQQEVQKKRPLRLKRPLAMSVVVKDIRIVKD
jgi:hypothetical protein